MADSRPRTRLQTVGGTFLQRSTSVKQTKRRARLSITAAALFGFLPAATLAQHYTQTNLVSDLSGLAPVIDPNLKNPWGLTRSSTGPWWIANNNSGTSTLYGATGTIIPLVVVVPPPKSAPNAVSAPTGIVYNGNSNAFLLAPDKPAAFIFATEDGTISGWNPGLNDGTHAVLVIDHSENGSPDGAVYKGATSGDIDGETFLFVTNFRSGKVEVYNSRFQRVHLGPRAFEDERIPYGYAAFNVQNIGGSIVVTYAKQDAQRHDPVFGNGGGFVDIYSTSGRLLRHLEDGWFDAPWGVVWTPRDFGHFANHILVGNFRSGWIGAYDGFTGRFDGFLKNANNDSLIFLDGIWSLTFGNDGKAGPATTLYFTAGLNDENDGSFGTLTPIAAEQEGDVE
jgi:uncharacterized protein (TIGR03118 family)